MRSWTVTAVTVATFLLGGMIARSAPQAPAARSVDEKILREYVGAYQWKPNAFVYLQMWNEFTGTNQLVAFDESGEVRTLYPTDRDRFFAGPGAAVPDAIESRIEFQRDGNDKITSLTWRRDGASLRIARRAEMDKREDVHFSSGDIQLAGTLISPNSDAKHPAIILVHGSRPQNRESMLPFARFLIATAWRSSGTTSGVWAAQQATGTQPPSTIWPAARWRPSST